MDFLLKFIISFIFTISIIQAEEKISLQLLWKHQFEFAGFYIAKEKGFYQNEGLDVNIKEYDFGIDITKDVLNGKSDIGIGRSSLILDKFNGSNITILNALYQNSPYVLISKQREDLKSVHDFINKKIMLSDASSVAAISSMLHINHVEEDDYQFISHSFNIDDLIENKVDLISTYLSNEPYGLQEKGIKYTVFDPKDYGFNFYADIIFTSKEYLAKNEEKIHKFQKASIKGWEYAFSHIDETVDLILKKYNSQNKTKEALVYEAQVLKDLAYDEGVEFGSISELRIQEIANVYRLLGLTNKLNEHLEGLIYKKENLFRKIFTKELLLTVFSLIVLIIIIVLYKQYLLKKQLEKQKELYELVFDNASDGVLLIDVKTGTFVKCNDQIVKILKANSKDDVLNTHPSELSPEFQPDGKSSKEKADEMIDIALKTGYNRFNWKHIRMNNEEFWVEVSLTKIIIDGQDTLYVTWKDIDKEIRAKEQLIESEKKLQFLNENLETKITERTQELEFAIRVKSDFLANMSHEIRTPLNGIIGFIDILFKTEKEKEKLEKLSIIKESGHSLLNIINDILDFSKIESNKMLIEKIPINVHSIFTHVTELFFSKAKEKDINIQLNISDDLPVKSLGDSTRLKQIFSNILSNAIKFSNEHSTIEVNISYIQDAKKLYCEVIDSGKGMAPENIQKVFKSFEQADSTVTRSHGGTGLGLAISKALVEHMGGEVGVKSELDKGSTFHYTIQLFDAEEELEEKSTPDLHTRELSGKALIVEDNKTNQMLLEMLLDELEIESDIVNDGLEAVEAVKNKVYDIILMDENMPNMNGIEATKIIRTFDNLKDLPIIAVTANALKGDREKFLSIGMNDYISKPIDANKLTLILSKYL